MSRESGIVCPACELGLATHCFSDLGSAPAGSDEASELSRLIELGCWKDAGRFGAANHLADIEVWRVLKCSGRSLSMSMMQAVLAFGLWTDDICLKIAPIGTTEAQELERLIAGAWHRWSKGYRMRLL